MIDNLEPKPDMWEANPKLKMLSLVFIFVFLFSGIGLVVLSQVQDNYRKKIYEETINGLPKHEVGVSENQIVGVSDTSNWKTYKNDRYGFEFMYPKDLLVRDKIFEAECEAQGKPDCKLDIVNYDLGVDYIKNNNYPKEAYCDTITGEKCEKMIIGGQDLIVNWQWGVYIPVKGVHNIFFEFKETEKVNKELLKQILSTFKFTK